MTIACACINILLFLPCRFHPIYLLLWHPIHTQSISCSPQFCHCPGPSLPDFLSFLVLPSSDMSSGGGFNKLTSSLGSYSSPLLSNAMFVVSFAVFFFYIDYYCLQLSTINDGSMRHYEGSSLVSSLYSNNCFVSSSIT